MFCHSSFNLNAPDDNTQRDDIYALIRLLLQHEDPIVRKRGSFMLQFISTSSFWCSHITPLTTETSPVFELDAAITTNPKKGQKGSKKLGDGDADTSD